MRFRQLGREEEGAALLLLLLVRLQLRLVRLNQEEEGENAGVNDDGGEDESVVARTLDARYGPPRIIREFGDLVDLVEIEYRHDCSSDVLRTGRSDPCRSSCR